MASKTIFGVVLWSDAQAGNAVVWCEDQGSLAYYAEPVKAVGQSTPDSISLTSGDLVEFVLRDSGTRREVTQPRLVNGQGQTLPRAARVATHDLRAAALERRAQWSNLQEKEASPLNLA